MTDSLCTSSGTQVTTSHQGQHALTAYSVFMDNDTLYIRFPAALPAYWLGTELQVANGNFKANIDGTAFGPEAELVYPIKKQELRLNKQSYSIGDTLRGYIELLFEEQQKANDQSYEFYVKGCIHKIVRPEGYRAFEDDEAIMSYELEYAVNELGEPLNDEMFTTKGLSEFRIELLNIFPPSDTIFIRELTWNTSSDAQLSDGGILRLTVWYAQENGVWKPVHFFRWNTFMQF